MRKIWFGHWPQWKRELILGGALNIIFVLSIIGIRTYFAKEEMDFLRDDSNRQEELIGDNKKNIEENTEKIKKNVNNITDLAGMDGDQYAKLAKMSTHINRLEQKIINLESKVDSLSIYDKPILMGTSGRSVIPFEKEYGTQNNYLRIFGRTGFEMDNGEVIASETNLGFDGSFELPLPRIVPGDIRGEYFAEVPDTTFESINVRGRRGNPLKLKTPRNQISVGPFAGIIYDHKTGLTEPVVGFGVSYNLFKVWDWK